MMTRAELEQWLLGALDQESVPLGDVADVVHVMVEASRRALAIADGSEMRQLRFTLAVLRDVFPCDADIRRWLRTPSWHGERLTPADLVSLGRIGDLVDLAVAEWNRPRSAPTVYAPAAMKHPEPVARTL